VSTVFGQQQDVKLSEGERNLVARLLSDPTYFPVEFRTWLKNYIEASGITVTASQITGGNRTRTGMPPGMIVMAATVGALPPDCLHCNGGLYLRSTYAQLFDKIGTHWGVGDGSTTFNVPDYRDRSLFGVGAVIAEATADAQAYGSRGGALHHHVTAIGYQSFTGGSQHVLRADTDIGGSDNFTSSGGGLADAPNWASVVYAITTGKTS